ncbi:MAG: endonuclease [Acidobacteriota bacterium]
MGQDRRFLQIYQALERIYPSPAGWPGGDWPVSRNFQPPGLEVVVGAILTQNVNWNNVEKALERMIQEGLVDEETILGCSLPRLEEAIRSSGFFRQKARRLKVITRFISDYPGDFYRQVQRAQLLAIKGVGPETADSILLYACDQTHFVIDAYTRRIFERYGILGSGASYDDIKDLFESQLPVEISLYKRFHALIVEHAKRSCRKVPLCRECVLCPECLGAVADS